MLDKFNEILGKISEAIWGLPLIILILVVGLFLTVRLKGVQFRKLGHALKSMFSKSE